LGIVQIFLGLMRKMLGQKFSFKQWKTIYEEAISGSRREQVALKNMARLANTREECEIVYDLAEPDSESWKIARDKLSGLDCRNFVPKRQKSE